jgi:putative hemolysin
MVETYLKYLAIALALVVAATACGCTAAGEQNGQQNRISGNGTVTYNDIEGGFYGIVTDTREKYLPLNLPDEFQTDGLEVTFVAEVRNGTATLQQWGVPIELNSIERTGPPSLVAGNGTIRFIDLEGGFYGIVTDDGGRYLPLALPERYRLDGMRVTFAAEVEEGVATLQQWGTPVTIIAVSAACHQCGGIAPWNGGTSAGGQMSGMPNPAAVWCEEQGNAYKIRKNPDGSEYGVCIFPNGTEIDAWEYYRQTH